MQTFDAAFGSGDSAVGPGAFMVCGERGVSF